MTSKTTIAISCLALFLALTGSAFAVGVAKNSVRSAQIVNGTVRTVDLRENAVKAAKVAPAAIGAEEIAENAVSSPGVAPDSLTSQDLGAASVGSSEIADGSVGAADLGPDSVAASELGTVVQRQSAPKAVAAGANGSVRVSCEPGEQLLSGGGQPSVFGVETTSSRPDGNAWLYQARNNSGSASTITAFALCLAN